MSLRQGPPTSRAPADESDAEEDALVEDYREQVRFDNADAVEDNYQFNDPTGGIGIQLATVAAPLEFGATLQTKLDSYELYCSLFHYFLNSKGPIDVEPPTVRILEILGARGT
jgi:translation initiation factor 3 subunit L